MRTKEENIKKFMNTRWQNRTCEEYPERSELYYAQVAIDTHGIALRDNTFPDLVWIGQRIEKDGE